MFLALNRHDTREQHRFEDRFFVFAMTLFVLGIIAWAML